MQFTWKYIELGNGEKTKIDREDLKLVLKLKPHKYGRYVYLQNGKHHIGLHRFLVNAKKGERVDHRNGSQLDNRKRNLRKCTQSQNLANQRLGSANTSGFKGVHFATALQCWIPQIKKNGKLRKFGLYRNKEVAARVYDRELLKMFGEFARLNFPDEDNSKYVPPEGSKITRQNSNRWRPRK